MGALRRKGDIHNHTEEDNKADRLSATAVERVHGRPRHTVGQCVILIIIVNLLLAMRGSIGEKSHGTVYVFHHIATLN